MTGYIWSFMIYTLGAIGVLFMGYVMAKRFIDGTFGANLDAKNFLKLEQGLRLEQKKCIYVIKAGEQRFLIASTPEKVSFLSELKEGNVPEVYTQNSSVAASSYTQENQSSQISYNTHSSPASSSAQKQQIHPDLEAKLKYFNVVKNALK